jgi:hypothetical protein
MNPHLLLQGHYTAPRSVAHHCKYFGARSKFDDDQHSSCQDIQGAWAHAQAPESGNYYIDLDTLQKAHRTVRVFCDMSVTPAKTYHGCQHCHVPDDLSDGVAADLRFCGETSCCVKYVPHTYTEPMLKTVTPTDIPRACVR